MPLKTPDLTGSLFVKPQPDISEIISHHAPGGNNYWFELF